jgi:formate dehydrogenase subunit gamma
MPPPESVERFDVLERAVHWANAVLFGILLATAAALYVAPISAAVGRREEVKTIHVYAGLLLPVPLLIAYLWPGGGRSFRADLARINRWTAGDRRWLRTRGRDAEARKQVGKFNAGQKLNAAFTGGAILVMLATGSLMRWPQSFPLSWRTGATFMHDWVAIALFVAITAHLMFAFSDSDALGGMWKGRVRPSWARDHHPLWLEELVGDRGRARPTGPAEVRHSP